MAHGKVIDTAFYVLDPTELNNPARHVPYPLEHAQNPFARAMGADGTARRQLICRFCKSATAPFPRSSPEWLDFRRELHMTDDKDLFIEKDAPGLLPLFEGKMIWQYSHQLDEAAVLARCRRL